MGLLHNIFEPVRLIRDGVVGGGGWFIGEGIPFLIGSPAVPAFDPVLGGLAGAGTGLGVCVVHDVFLEPGRTRGRMRKALEHAREKRADITEDVMEEFEKAYDFYDKQGIKERWNFVNKVEEAVYVKETKGIMSLIGEKKTTK